MKLDNEPLAVRVLVDPAATNLPMFEVEEEDTGNRSRNLTRTDPVRVDSGNLGLERAAGFRNLGRKTTPRGKPAPLTSETFGVGYFRNKAVARRSRLSPTLRDFGRLVGNS